MYSRALLSYIHFNNCSVVVVWIGLYPCDVVHLQLDLMWCH